MINASISQEIKAICRISSGNIRISKSIIQNILKMTGMTLKLLGKESKQ